MSRLDEVRVRAEGQYETGSAVDDVDWLLGQYDELQDQYDWLVGVVDEKEREIQRLLVDAPRSRFDDYAAMVRYRDAIDAYLEWDDDHAPGEFVQADWPFLEQWQTCVSCGRWWPCEVEQLRRDCHGDEGDA